MDAIRGEIIRALVWVTLTGIPTYLITDSNNKSEIKVKAEKVEELSSKSTEYKMLYEKSQKETDISKIRIPYLIELIGIMDY